MISQMTKYSFILLSKEQETFLKNISKLGVVDISRSSKPVDDESADLLETATKMKTVAYRLNCIDYQKDPDYSVIKEAAATISLETSDAEDIVSRYEQTETSLSELTTALGVAKKEMKARKPWGAFDMDSIARLRDLGYIYHFYCTNTTAFGELEKSRNDLNVISQEDNSVYFVTISHKDEDYSFPIQECPAPLGCWTETAKVIETTSREIINTKATLLRLKEKASIVNKASEKAASNLEMYLAGAAGTQTAGDFITVFTGFAPVEEDSRLCEEFDKMDVYYVKEKASLEDNPPIKLKNNKFSKMFEVLTGMYGMPVYNEFDPTPILAPFFMLFFAMCMGDAGYGIVLMLLGGAMCKGWLKIDMFKGLGPLITVLGASTFVIGIVLGTFFGIDMTKALWTPEWMKSIMVTGNIAGFPAQMVMALGVGVFHVCLAMTVKAICSTKRFGFKKTISTWGWLILIVGGIALAALGLLNVLDSTIMKVAVITLGIISFLAIYIFNTPGRNPLANIGSGLWDTYNMATGLLGDILSYIRLYALGLAGGMLGNAFNILGGMVLGDGGIIQWVFFLLIILFGHVLNIAMSCLGAFVHPLRLTFVEYFKNAGYEGKGKMYKPLKTETKYE